MNRRSCDRCRHQKVRCLPAKMLRDTAESIYTCERCNKAGMSCVYSRKCSAAFPQRERGNKQSWKSVTDSAIVKQKLGRPISGSRRLRQPETWTPSLRPIDIDPAEVYLTATPSDSLSDIAESMQFSAGMENQIAGVYFDNATADIDIDICISNNTPDWDLNFSSSNKSLSELDVAMPRSETSFLEDPRLMEMHDPPVFSQSSAIVPQIEAWATQLVILDTQLLQSASAIAQDNSNALTVSSPHVQKLLEATNKLSIIMHSLRRISDEDDSRAGDGWSVTGPKASGPLSSDLIFLTLSCHQGLLGVIQAICLAIHLQLRAIDTPEGVCAAQSEDAPSCMAEFAILIGLLGCLVSRVQFDWAVCMSRSVLSGLSPGFLGWSNGGMLSLASGVIERIPQQHASLVVMIEELLLRIDGPKDSLECLTLA
ncbi:hypothetical protein BJY04DRAFT_122411 [Aspergillus karnatakaensis]|uniref:Zn(II)2Cys6 transcription factor domain-containing protein n=1 Tax=Aspergillus karnatakaensis TaxID=1810916 RepID=UPI003CCD6D65